MIVEERVGRGRGGGVRKGLSSCVSGWGVEVPETWCSGILTSVDVIRVLHL